MNEKRKNIEAFTLDSPINKPKERSMKQTDAEHYVKKSNDLIEAHYQLSSAEQKFVITVISLIDKNDEDFKEYCIPIKNILELLDITDRSYHSRLHQRVKSIFKKQIVLKRDESELICTWFSSVEIHKEKGYVSVCFDPKLKPYLIKLNKKFTSYRFKNIGRLRSSVSIRIYEILKGLEKTDTKKREFVIDDLKSILGVKNKYNLYGHFKNKILDKARVELDEKTDITFSFRERKVGRKVEGIIFYVLKNSTKNNPEEKRVPEGLIRMIPDNFIDDALDISTQIYKEKGADCLKYYIEQVNTAYQVLGNDLKSYGAYMRKLYKLKKYDEYIENTPNDLRDISITPGEYLKVGGSSWRQVQTDKSINVEGKIYKEIDLKKGILEGKIIKYEKKDEGNSDIK